MAFFQPCGDGILPLKVFKYPWVRFESFILDIPRAVELDRRAVTETNPSCRKYPPETLFPRNVRATKVRSCAHELAQDQNNGGAGRRPSKSCTGTLG